MKTSTHTFYVPYMFLLLDAPPFFKLISTKPSKGMNPRIVGRTSLFKMISTPFG